MTGDQCRAARGLLDWTLDQLATASKVGRTTIIRFENGETNPHGSTLELLRRTFAEAGITFVESNGQGEGVRFSKRPEERDEG
ncbi:MAG: helix-turn-helix transcriptional regulator [Myxococcales bacterium]|nr:helix-turn-helix transcriptional regulator [Myxococcales bacterium]